MLVRVASTWWSRVRGLLWGASPDDLLVIVPCSDVHTFFMRHPIDVAFVGFDGTVIRAERRVVPGKRLGVPGSALVIERFASDLPWYRPRDQVFAVRLRDPAVDRFFVVRRDAGGKS